MKKTYFFFYSIIFGCLLSFLLFSPISINKAENNNVSSVQTETKSIPIEFSHTEDFLINIEETKVEAEEFNGSEFLDALKDFNQTGIDVYTGSDIIPGPTAAIPGSGTLSYLVVNITESYIYDANEPFIDPSPGGEIYYKIWINGNYTRFPQEGEIEGVNDKETITLDVVGFEGWTWNNTVEVEIWESDTDADDDLGKITYSTGNPTDETIELKSDNGDANVTIQFNVTGTRNTLTAQDLLWGYQPYLYIDDETSGTEEPDGIYGRVCIGMDETKGKTLWALQYFFYWEKETYGTSFAEVQIHQYDYEEFLIFLDPADITKPIRIVFDQAQSPFYPSHEFMVYEQSPLVTGNQNQTINFTEELQPFLGTNLTIDYKVEDLSLLYNDYISSQLGGQTLKLKVDTFYHAFDTGEGSNETAFHYQVQELDGSILKNWYSHLNESLHGDIHNIPIISYTTPAISPFTFDVSNPFQRPYIINAWSNVMEDLDAFAKAQSQDITINADMNITVTLAVEATLTIEYPETVSAGETYDLNYSIVVYDDTVIVTTDYDIDVNVSTNFWFLGGEMIVFQNGSFTVDVPLGEFKGLLDFVGAYPQTPTDRIMDKINQYLTATYLEIAYLSISPQLLGTFLNASVRLNFWDIAKDFVPVIISSLTPQFYPVINTAFRVLDKIISHIALEAEIVLQTMISGSLFLSDGDLGQLSQTSIEFNESGEMVSVELTIAASPTNPNLKVTLSDIANGVNFFIDWYFNAGLEQPFSYFIDDFRKFIGRYPSYNMDLPTGLIEANVTTASIDMTILGVTTQPTTTTTSAGTVPSTTSQAGNGFMVIDIIAILGIGLIWNRKKRK